MRRAQESPLSMANMDCLSILRVPDQIGLSQACYIVKIYHSGPKHSIYFFSLLLFFFPVFLFDPFGSHLDVCT